MTTPRSSAEGDPHASTLAAIDDGLRSLTLEAWTPRRSLDRPAPELYAALRTPLERLLADARAGAMGESYAVHMSTVWTPALGSLLFACGAPHPMWRRWTALGAVACALVGEYRSAVTLGAISHAWEIVDRIRGTSEGFDASWGGLWRLLGKAPRVDLAAVRDAPEAIAAWSALVEAADDGDVEPALARVVDLSRAADDRVTPDAIMMTDPTGVHFQPSPWAATSDSGTAAAAAAIFARRGWRPSAAFGEQRARLVEPGWVSGAPLGDVEGLVASIVPPTADERSA